MSFLRPEPSDAPAFITQLDVMVSHATRQAPPEVYVVRIDNWFGDRWVGFAGKCLGAFGVNFLRNLPLPPFVPSRVVEQVCYRLLARENRYVRDESAPPLHVRQTSSANFRRLVDDLFPNAVLVWFSDRSAQLGRGSIMIYVPTDEGHVAWYGAFDAGHSWAPTRLIGITRAELEMAAHSGSGHQASDLNAEV